MDGKAAGTIGENDYAASMKITNKDIAEVARPPTAQTRTRKTGSKVGAMISPTGSRNRRSEIVLVFNHAERASHDESAEGVRVFEYTRPSRILRRLHRKKHRS